MPKGESEAPRQVVVTLGPTGMHAFLAAYRAAAEGAEVNMSIATAAGVDVLLMEVGGIGTMLPASDAGAFAEELLHFPWRGEAQGKAMRHLGWHVQAMADEYAARQGPKH